MRAAADDKGPEHVPLKPDLPAVSGLEATQSAHRWLELSPPLWNPRGSDRALIALLSPVLGTVPGREDLQNGRSKQTSQSCHSSSVNYLLPKPLKKKIPKMKTNIPVLPASDGGRETKWIMHRTRSMIQMSAFYCPDCSLS